MSSPDLALAKACANGNPVAWRAFVDRYARLVLLVVRRTADRYGTRLDASEEDDLCAGVFYGLLKDGAAKLRAYDPRWALSTYLGAIARSAAIDALRARRREGAASQPVAPDETAAAMDPIPGSAAAAPGPGPAESLERSETARAVDAVLASLAPRERLVVRLFYYGGFKYREIAETLGIPLNTVCSTLARALEKLRDRLPPNLP